MADFDGHPETYTFGKMTFTRSDRGVYTVVIEGVHTAIGFVTPGGESGWHWLHVETGRSGVVNELPGAGYQLSSIESTRS